MTYRRPKIIAFFKLYPLLFCVVIAVSCGTNKEVAPSKKTSEVKDIPKIVFLNYSIKKNKNGDKTVALLNSKKVEGKLKHQKKILDKNPNLGDLVCVQLDGASATLSQQLIKNPLQKRVEYVDESKHFKVAEMELDSAEFSVRLQLYPETQYIVINGEQRPLLLTKIAEL